MDAARPIANAMSIPARRSFQGQMDALVEATAEDYRAGLNVVLLLDDAQLMHRDALEVIHRLYNFEYDSKVVQVLAFGQQELTGLFDSVKAVRSRVFARMVLPPLTLHSALQMVLFRLQVAGRREPLINDDAFELLYDHSGGVPREIVRLCALAPDTLFQPESSLIDVDIINQVFEVV
jgi:general secretion pathway protein A